MSEHYPRPWEQPWKEFLVEHLPQRQTRRVYRHQQNYGLEDILTEAEFKKAIQLYMEFDASASQKWYVNEDILEKIMQKVLFQDLICWRRVCKRWNLAGMTEEWTSEVNMQSQTIIPLIMRFRELSAPDAALLVLNPDYRKWFRINIGRTFTCLHLYCEDGRNCSPCFQCTAVAALGLFIFTCRCSVHWNSDLCLIICNPVTMNMKSLLMPQLPGEYIIQSEGYFRLAGVIESTLSDEKHYRQLFSTLYPNFTESFKVYCVYNAKNCSWTFGRGPIESLPFIVSKASCKGCFYFLYPKVQYTDLSRKPLFEPRMGKYDSETDNWSEIAWVPKHEGAEHLPQLVHCRGKVMYVARGSYSNPQSTLLHQTWYFYKLDESSSLPSELWTNTQHGGLPSETYMILCSSTPQFYDVRAYLRQDIRCEGYRDKVFFYCVQPCIRNTMQSPSVLSISEG